MAIPQDNPMVPPGGFPPPGNPLMMPGMPMMPPPPPSPSLGFQAWASDPQNSMKVQHSMVAPDAPLQPNAGNAMTPPAQAPMASVMPPQQQAPPNAMIPPGQQAPSPMGAPAATPPNVTVAPPATYDQDAAAHPGKYASPYLTGTKSKLLNAAVAALQGVAGGLHGNPGAGVDYAMGVKAHDEGLPAANQALYQNSVVNPYNATLDRGEKQRADAANLAHTRAETSSLGANDAIKSQNSQASLAKAGLKTVLDENGKPSIVPDEDSPAFQKQQMEQGLIKAHTDSYAATNELHAAQAAFAKAKNDPNSPIFRQTAARLATAQANAASANTRAQAYMGNYLQHAYNKGLDGGTLTGAPIISDDAGDQSVVGSTNAGTAIKNQSNAAQFNDVHGALDNLEGTARALTAKGGSVNSPGVVAALGQPAGTLGKWLQGAGVKANLTPEERAYVQSVASAHENIQALRKSAGGTATDSAVEKLDSMIPNASTPDLNYLLGQTGQIRATATRLGKGATVASGGLTVKGQGNGNAPKVNNMIPPPQGGAVSVTAPDGTTHSFKDQAAANKFKALAGMK